MARRKKEFEREDGFKELNLHFLDLILKRLEYLIEFKTIRMYGADAPTSEESLKRSIIECEDEIQSLRNQTFSMQKLFPLDEVSKRYALTQEEFSIIQVALAPALDSTFKKRIARFKDDILQDFVDVAFILNLLFDTRLERLHARNYFNENSKLVKEKLISLKLPRDVSTETLLNYEIHLPERLIEYILGRKSLDKTITNFCTLESSEVPLQRVVLPANVKEDLLEILKGYDHKKNERLVLQFSGPPGTGKTLFIQAIANHLDMNLINVDSSKIATIEHNFPEIIENIFFDAKLHNSIVSFDHCDAIFNQKNPRIPTILSKMENFGGITALITNDPKSLDSQLERWIQYQIDFEIPDASLREEIWKIHLEESGLLLDNDVDLQYLGATFEFGGSHIKNAVSIAKSKAISTKEKKINQKNLINAAYTQIRADMEEYAKKRKVPLTLNDLILPEDELKLVSEVLDAAKYRAFIMHKWGFGKKLATGKGLVCLFVGESGTGKTLCAEILASELKMNLFHVSIPRIMSKYIGETEKNIEKVFSSAKANHALLLFDEADALFSSRVKVETSVDRFSNMEINLLLQEIERFEGIVILTSNLDKNIDKAFERRINFKIRFPFPDAKYRALIWRTLIPKECPLSPDIDFELLGKSFELPGGHIKNAIIRAAYKAAKASQPINMQHFFEAAEQECKAAGRLYRDRKAEDEYS